MTVQELINQGYGGYAGWSDAAATADFNATGGEGKRTGGGGSSGGGDSIDSILQNAINAILGVVPNSVQPYDEVNPFFFDEELARQASEAQYSPYYQEKLSDYTSSVEKTKSRSEEDFKRLLEQLGASKEYYTGTQRKLLDRSMKNVNEGYSGRGLFFSGARDEDRTELHKEYESDLSEYNRKYTENINQAKLLKERTWQDANEDLSLYTRDNEREKDYAVETGVLQRKSEVQEEHEEGRKKYYEGAQYGGLYA